MTSEAPFLPALVDPPCQACGSLCSLFSPANLRLPSSDENRYQTEAATCFGAGGPFCFVREMRSTDFWAAAFQHSRMRWLWALVIAAGSGHFPSFIFFFL